MGHAYIPFAMGVFLRAVILAFVILLASDCGKNRNVVDGSLAPEGVDSNSQENVEFTLQPVTSESVKPQLGGSLNVVTKNLTKNPVTGQISFRADVDGQKNIAFVGSFEKGENSAHLFGPDKDTEAVAVCADDELCNTMVVNVYKKGEGHQQFTTSVQGMQPQIDTDEEDEGLGVDEYVVPPASFDGGSLNSNNNLSKLPWAYGPHAASYDKENKKWSFGTLAHGVSFPSSGPGFIVRGKTDGLWTTGTLSDLITQVASETASHFSNRPLLQIGDGSKKNGGYFSPHISHENGLDIDIAYPVKEQKNISSWEDMVDGKNALNPNFDLERFWFIAKKLVQLSDVPFIFVDMPIKLAMCKYSKSIKDYSDKVGDISFKALIAMRPAFNGRAEGGHRNHFHVRQQCPTWMSGCLSVNEPPTKLGTGCPLSI